MNMAVFWLVLPCSLVEVYRRFSRDCCLHQEGDDGGSKHLLNVGKLLPDYTRRRENLKFHRLFIFLECSSDLIHKTDLMS
jgi:hypothetical protein